MATINPQQPFPYEDSMESVIQSVIDRNNQFDPTGKANELRIPPRRLEQRFRHAKWYDPKQHAASPYVSAYISADTSLTLGSPYTISVTIRHNPNPIGNPESKPVTFDLSDTGLTAIGGGEDWQLQIYPWLLLHRDPTALQGGLKELEVESQGHGPADMFESGNDDEAEPQLPEIRPDNGFVTLAVGETKTFEVQWKDHWGLLEAGERYQLCFRGTFLRWWKWGTMEEMRGEKKTEQGREVAGRLWIACTNAVEFTVASS